MNLDTVLLSMSFKPVDIVFVALFLALVVAILVFVIIHQISEKKTEKVIKEEFERLQVLDEKGSIEATPVVAVEDVKKNAESEVETPQKETEEPIEEKPIVEEEIIAEDEPISDEEAVLAAEAEVALESESVESKETPLETEEVALEEASVAEDETTEEPASEAAEENEELVVEKAKRQYNGKYEIYKENEYFRYRLKASNGEVLFVSEVYTSRDGAVKSIGAVQRNLEKGKIDIFADKRKNYKFQLKAANHRVLAISANYSTAQGAQNASESFKRFAVTQDIVDVELPAEELDATSLVEIPKVKEEDKKGGKLVLRKDPHGVFSWELKASNGEILCQADGYSSKSSLETSIDSFKVSVKNGKFFIYADKGGLYQFKLYSQSGRVAMVGESYPTSQQAKDIVTSILNFLDLAVIVDKTVAPVKKTEKKPVAKK